MSNNEKKASPKAERPRVVLPKIAPPQGPAEPVRPNGRQPAPEPLDLDEPQGTGIIEEPEIVEAVVPLTPQCGNCLYFVTQDRNKLADGTPWDKIPGQCRAHCPAPIAVIRDSLKGPMQIVDGFFSPVRGDVWCGDWKQFPPPPITH